MRKSKISRGGGNPPCYECPQRYIYVTLVAPMAGWRKEVEGDDAVNRKKEKRKGEQDGTKEIV